jgi:hydrogenase maturation protease
MKPIAIIGVGNYLMGDEGVGIHVTQRLRKEFMRDDCDIIDAGVPSMALLHMMEGRNLVIIIDCADFGGTPGEIKSFRPEQVKREENKEISLHATDLLTTLDVGRSIGLQLPPIWIIGIQPARVEQTMKLSDQVSRALEKIPDAIKNVIAS